MLVVGATRKAPWRIRTTDDVVIGWNLSGAQSTHYARRARLLMFLVSLYANAFHAFFIIPMAPPFAQHIHTHPHHHITTMNIPWQLYLFGIVQLVGSFFMYGFFLDPCQLLTGKGECKSGAEMYSARAMAIAFLYIGVFFLSLTYLNKDSAPKLKRLANMATNCVVATLVGTVFTGSTSMGGVERSVFHMMDMIGMFLLLIIIMSAVMNDSEMAGYKSPLAGLGVNPKSFVLLVTIAVAVKLFALSDFVDLTSFLADPDSTSHLSRVLWAWMSVYCLEVLFPLAFALAFGDEKDQEAITIATVVVMLVSIVSIIPVAGSMKDGTMRSSYISAGVTLALAIVAVMGGRRSRSSQGYETVSTVV